MSSTSPIHPPTACVRAGSSSGEPRSTLKRSISYDEHQQRIYNVVQALFLAQSRARESTRKCTDTRLSLERLLSRLQGFLAKREEERDSLLALGTHPERSGGAQRSSMEGLTSGASSLLASIETVTSSASDQHDGESASGGGSGHANAPHNEEFSMIQWESEATRSMLRDDEVNTVLKDAVQQIKAAIVELDCSPTSPGMANAPAADGPDLVERILGEWKELQSRYNEAQLRIADLEEERHRGVSHLKSYSVISDSSMDTYEDLDDSPEISILYKLDSWNWWMDTFYVVVNQLKSIYASTNMLASTLLRNVEFNASSTWKDISRGSS